MADTSRLDELKQLLADEQKRLRNEKREEQKRKTPISDSEQLTYFKSLLSYDPISGIFNWLVKRHRHGGMILPGDAAGSLHVGKGRGYIIIGVDGKMYRAHRLAWWFMTGSPVPEDRELDHEDRIRHHNWWSNLRLATRPQNTMNSGIRSDNTSGVKGVYWIKARQCWMAKIVVNGKPVHLGYTDTVEQAAELRKAADIHYGGEFTVHPERVSDYQPKAVGATYRKSRANSSGVPGVSWHKAQQKWCAFITVNGKKISLGYSKTLEGAAELRRVAEEKYHGEFKVKEIIAQ